MLICYQTFVVYRTLRYLVPYSYTLSFSIITRGVNRAGPGPGRVLKLRAGPARRAGPGLTWAGRAGPGRAERFYNLLGIRAGFLQSFTRTNFLTN